MCEQVGFEVKNSQHIRGTTVVPQRRGIEGSEKDLIGDVVCDWDPEKLLETGGGGLIQATFQTGGGQRVEQDFFFLKKKEKKKEEHKEIQKLN